VLLGECTPETDTSGPRKKYDHGCILCIEIAVVLSINTFNPADEELAQGRFAYYSYTLGCTRYFISSIKDIKTWRPSPNPLFVFCIKNWFLIHFY